ncbi:hypothetical protein XBI1_1520001 [Xenorhabdus bovienii str. Intermedium]|uniref:Uncharacterized protein n=1 Tax=Xenorhabdus bovienii str. Intermedium TaxID=1379677 RepID=A0A077QE92_XENBV|nr:hypothetical protein XBI1_1520001 [Xenorhabdus bovienii str. Intermedium]
MRNHGVIILNKFQCLFIIYYLLFIIYYLLFIIYYFVMYYGIILIIYSKD